LLPRSSCLLNKLNPFWVLRPESFYFEFSPSDGLVPWSIPAFTGGSNFFFSFSLLFPVSLFLLRGVTPPQPSFFWSPCQSSCAQTFPPPPTFFLFSLPPVGLCLMTAIITEMAPHLDFPVVFTTPIVCCHAAPALDSCLVFYFKFPFFQMSLCWRYVDPYNGFLVSALVSRFFLSPPPFLALLIWPCSSIVAFRP